MRQRSSKFLLQSIAVFSVLAFVPFLYFYSQFTQIDDKTELHIEQINRNKLEYAKVELQNSLQKMSESLRYLSHNNILLQALINPTETNTEALQDFWLLIARTQGYYSQLRFLDQEGQEIVRVNSGDGFIELVEEENLQNKSHRDYFTYARALGNREVGTFGIDLEQENGELVQPLTPTYRIIYPLNFNGQRLGYFVANLDLVRIYKSLAYKNHAKNLPSIVTAQGYYLMTPNGNDIMGHLVEENANINVANQYPLLWRGIQLSDSGTVKDQQGWYSFTKTQVGSSDNISAVTLFLKTDASEALAFSSDERRVLYQQGIFILIILILLTFTFVTWNYNHEKNSLDSKIARAAMNGMSAMIITDRNNRIIQVNEEFTRVSGFELEDVKGQKPSLFSSGKHSQEFYLNMWKQLENTGIWEGEVINKRRDGSHITQILRIQTVKHNSDTIQFYVASFVDISHRKELENRLRDLSEKDSMTSLWNRRKFDSEMQAHSARTKRYTNQAVSVLALIDIDHFKRVNDRYGHDKGDAVIRQVAKSLEKQLRETDLVARIGGEEFALILPHTDLREAEVVLNRIRVAVSLESELNITVSAGLTEICSHQDETYKRADIALYESKSLGRNKVSILSMTENDSIA
ncbi:sensory box/GGDEF family protein [Vibrio orientalis CIP 102891 = ATCC 33934]|uniref:diguanylate cyclase n=1 Tax=Vibrio orientalis CIP 102891 = ATCC 33934 TaxID=675816 RepID=C9QDU8_VIBOR|nr:diguanylate cyclase [Vibrio orientalis]EEX94088.1 sensory box/GGDEF family protein [Vibrio orientalis CIP 102891 = ATCC 33934]EGU52769.1 sensory box/GGDEF family protein [Vibrio orientalis CIP 102891 = ATCC 33934]